MKFNSKTSFKMRQNHKIIEYKSLKNSKIVKIRMIGMRMMTHKLLLKNISEKEVSYLVKVKNNNKEVVVNSQQIVILIQIKNHKENPRYMMVNNSPENNH